MSYFQKRMKPKWYKHKQVIQIVSPIFMNMLWHKEYKIHYRIVGRKAK